MNAAIAGYLNTKESQIISVEEWAHVYFVKVKGFSPLFISKAKLAKFIADNKKAYNPGRFTHFGDAKYCKSYGKCPLWKSPEARAHQAKLAEMRKLPTIDPNHPAAAFFPAAA
jgi:hypothetical protein